MTGTSPPLNEGEEIVFDHIPSLRAFKKTAAFLLILTLIPTGVIAVFMPDSLFVMAPIFLTCILLLQDRFTIGRYRAWISNQRILRQGGDHLDLADIVSVTLQGSGVRLKTAKRGQGGKLYYPADGPALLDAINAARGV